MSALLEVRELSRRFGGVTALSEVSFGVSEGEVVAMIGPNGAGKSTCFNIIDGQLRPDSGSVRLGAQDITRLRTPATARLGVGRTFQVAASFGSLSLAENIETAILARERAVFSLRHARRHTAGAEARDILDRVGMAEEAGQTAGRLNYGDVKRLELAIALAGRPRILLMDEPTAGMAPGERRQLMRLVEAIAREEGLSVLFTEHDMDVVFDHAERIIVLERGRVIADGTPQEVRADRRVQESYLGAVPAGDS